MNRTEIKAVMTRARAEGKHPDLWGADLLGAYLLGANLGVRNREYAREGA